MEFSFGVSKHIQEKFEKFAENTELSQEEKDEIVLMINMAYSSGEMSGSKNANIIGKKLGNWSQNC